jgi:hypothetical protein
MKALKAEYIYTFKMRNILAVYILLFSFACSQPSKGNTQQEISIPEPKKSEQVVKSYNVNPQIAVDFINAYIDNLEKMGNGVEIRKWSRTSGLVTANFISDLENLITEAYEREPDYGLGFDPILDAQDYPDGGFKLLNFDETSGLTTVIGMKDENFQINLLLINQNGQTLVDGCGVVNLKEEQRAKR